MKTCSECNLEKAELLFRKDRNQCKECYEQHRAEYRMLNKNKIKEDKKVFYENNADQIKEDSLSYYKDNKEKRKEYLENNKDTIKSKRNFLNKNRYENDTEFKLRKLFSNSILRSISNKKSYKNGSIKKYLAYTIEVLKIHLESQFESWMTWDNQGRYNPKTWDDNDQSTWTWQIDHIIPHSTFRYTSMDSREFRECWALSNLRPLSAKQNWLDGIKRTRHVVSE